MLRTVVQHNLNTIRGTVMKTKTQNEKSHRFAMAASLRSGEAGIRTLGTLARTLVFETSTIGHSVTSPKADRRRANHTPPLPSFPDGCAPFRRPASVAIGPASGASECIELPRPILFNLDKNNQHFASCKPPQPIGLPSNGWFSATAEPSIEERHQSEWAG
jgi:hypothetical protein